MAADTNMEAQKKFQNLLRDLFQFDLVDLDFGIYRIMNHKRQVIERWIAEDLPKAIQEELNKGALAEQQQAQQALEKARQKVLETLGEEALDAEGNLAEPYCNTKIGREYLEAREKAAHAKPGAALEAQVYNHLYTFFSRYYQDGDFISKRRYSKKERYAIPYNGEEVYLYWANHDQYYVKTAEHFTDYTWKAPLDVTVHFKLQAADVEQNNVKGEKRFFLPVLGGIAWDAKTRTLTIPFHYRPLTEQEKITYGNKKQQDKILEEALNAIPDKLKSNADALAALTNERRKDAKGNPVSYLEHHLRQYTARNTRDFFIHKDLRGFLSRELDFYLKNEVLNLEELEAAGEHLAEGWFQLMRLIKRIGNHIIDFLAQIEDFQKALWEKKKFVTETFWCITVGLIPGDFYPEIAENEAQWQEWQALFALDALPKDMFSGDLNTQEGRIAFLKAHPTLVLDTRHFSRDFSDRLLARFENLDEATDGLLVHSENWQALNLLQEKYRERVKTIYIDPPYNTGNDEFLYRDNYQHSGWLSMMYDRMALARVWMQGDGVLFASIDDNEFSNLRISSNELMGKRSFLGEIVWKTTTDNNPSQIAIEHEYIMAWAKDKTSQPHWSIVDPRIQKLQEKYEELRNKHGNKPDIIQKHLREWIRKNRKFLNGVTHFNRVDDKGIYSAQNPANPHPGGYFYEVIHPATKKVCKIPTNGFRFPKSTFEELARKGDIEFGPDERTIPKPKKRLEVSRQFLRSVYYEDNRISVKKLDEMFGRRVYENPKSLNLLKMLLHFTSDTTSYILDFFAGSGTTGHAVINLNREDGGRRKFILVEMGEYFDTVLLPRIKKVTFTPEWKDGRPKRTATQEEFERGPHIVKVIRLESYEDALNNITFDEESGQKALDFFGDEYLLRYMLKWETKKSETFLDVEHLQSPFSYKLRIHRDGETREKAVDLPETFACLIGLDVEARRVYHDGERRYLVHRGISRDGHKVAVIWRETKDWTQADYERDAAFVAEQKLAEGADEVFVNGDSFIPGASSLDGIFKARLFGQEG